VTSPPSSAGALAAAIRSERAGVQALVQALTEERQLLTDGNTDPLTEMGARKRELLLDIARLGDQRNRTLRQCGMSPDGRGMRALLDSPAATHEIRAEWRLLIETTRQARHLNDGNGLIIADGMRANHQALSVLVSAASAGTYGPGGRTVSPLSSRTLGSA